MIDLGATSRHFGYEKPKFRHPVIVICDECSKENQIIYRERLAKSGGEYICPSCSAKKRWNDKNYSDRTLSAQKTDSEIKRRSKSSKELWKDDKYRKIISDAISDRWGSQEYREKISELSKARWEDPEYRSKITNIMKSDGVLAKIVSHPSRTNKVSNLQQTLYKILDDLGIKYFRERNDTEDDSQCHIGPYSFDCVIPGDNKTLLIEVQGEYWHSSVQAARRDKAKAVYISNFSEYELKYLLESDFYSIDKVRNLILYWLGINHDNVISFDFGDVDIKIIDNKQYAPFFGAYHYLPNCRRGGVCYGAFINGELAAVSLFSSVIRQNVKFDGVNSSEIVEISRFCISPKFQKKHFASWFISRCLRKLSKNIKVVVAYSDLTFNHHGTIYKAANFKLDKIIPPDYIYKDESGWIMHKKTLYNQAKSCHMKESDYAKLRGFVKCFGLEKLRFVYFR